MCVYLKCDTHCSMRRYCFGGVGRPVHQRYSVNKKHADGVQDSVRGRYELEQASGSERYL